MDKAKIDFAEINKYGAVVVYGSEGISIITATPSQRQSGYTEKTHGSSRITGGEENA